MAVNDPLNSERHYIALSLWTYLFPIASLFRLTTEYIAPRERAPSQSLYSKLFFKPTKSGATSWNGAKGTLAFALEHQACVGSNFKAREFIGISYAAQSMVQRFIAALELMRLGAQAMEREIQALAGKIFELQEEAQWSENWQCDVLMTQKV